jgi:hypothetical protein
MYPSSLITSIIEGVKSRRMLGMRMIMQRANEFPSKEVAQLTGIALDSDARQFANEQIDKRFRSNRTFGIVPVQANEVIIGSGFHAAVYAATRVLIGKQPPVILERNEYAGGVFAIPGDDYSYPGVFNLNSRNRRGLSGLSGDNEAQLNYLPGAPIQASALSNAEYQTNADMAFVIRLTLAQYAPTRVFPSAEVTNVSVNDGGTFDVKFNNGYYGERRITTERVIDARGLGDSQYEDNANNSSILTFPQFMQRMSGIWPLRNLRNVAVIGGGDSGKCSTESLLGLAPQSFMGAAELDSVNRIDWYAPDIDSTYDSYCRNNRGRYRAIGRYLRPDTMGNKRLNVFNQSVYPIALPSGGALINGRQYDLVIIAAGNKVPSIEGLNWRYSNNVYADSIRNARVIAKSNEQDYGDYLRYRIGPRADIEFDDSEYDAGITDIRNNRVAMFRLATRTAALATKLS